MPYSLVLQRQLPPSPVTRPTPTWRSRSCSTPAAASPRRAWTSPRTLLHYPALYCDVLLLLQGDLHCGGARHLPDHLHRLPHLSPRTHGESRQTLASCDHYFTQLSVDIYLRRAGEDQIIGRTSAKTDEDGMFGKDDDVHTTSSIILQQILAVGDQVSTTVPGLEFTRCPGVGVHVDTRGPRQLQARVGLLKEDSLHRIKNLRLNH